MPMSSRDAEGVDECDADDDESECEVEDDETADVNRAGAVRGSSSCSFVICPLLFLGGMLAPRQRFGRGLEMGQ